MNFIAKKSDLLFNDKFYADYKSNLSGKLYQNSGGEGGGPSGQLSTDPDDEVWTKAEVDASNYADHKLRERQKESDDNADSKFKSKRENFF